MRVWGGYKPVENGLLKSLMGPHLPTENSTEWSSGSGPELGNLSEGQQQLTRGCRSPDDPESLLYEDPIGVTKSKGWDWYWAQRSSPTDASNPHLLTAVFFTGPGSVAHGMATEAGEDAKTTQVRILKWTGFLADVATGKIDPDARASEYLGTLLAYPSLENLTVRELLSERGVIRGKKNAVGPPDRLTDLAVRQRAAGALLHTIQDSFTDSHTARTAKLEITQFRLYGQQDPNKHAAADSWVREGMLFPSPAKTLGARVDQLHGARDSVNRSVEVLRLLDQGDPDEVRKYLEERVFNLAEKTESAGPGDEYRKESSSDCR